MERTLVGWETMGDFEAEVKDSAIYLDATHPYNNAWLLTAESYRDFELELDFFDG